MNFLITFLLLFVIFSSFFAVSSQCLFSGSSLLNHPRPKRYGEYENGQYHHRHHKRIRVHIHMRDPQQFVGYGSGGYNNAAGYGYGYNSANGYSAASYGYGNVGGYGYSSRGYNGAGGYGYGWGGK